VKRQKKRQPPRHQENLIPAIDKPCRFACDLYAWSIGAGDASRRNWRSL
jgi:hypothetical protein